MKTQTPHAAAARAPDLPPRARSFGTGYGRSSGYAAPRSYSRPSVPARFRVV